MTSRLTRPSPSSRPSRRNPGQSGVLFRRDRLSPNQLNHQDPFILRHGSQPTANRLPLLSRGDLCNAHCSVLVRKAHNSRLLLPPLPQEAQEFQRPFALSLSNLMTDSVTIYLKLKSVLFLMSSQQAMVGSRA